MRFIYQLLKLRFLTPYSLWLLYKAKRKHGNNLCFLLKFAADYYGDKVAVADGTARLNFKELYEKVLHLSFLLNEAIQPAKNSVAILICNNSVNHILALYAIQNMGMKLILVNDKLHPNDIQKIIGKQANPYYVFGSAPSIATAIDIDNLIAVINSDSKNQLFSRHSSRVIFPTSGTTGEAKLIEKKSGEFYWLQSFADLIKRTSIDKRNTVYISVPVSHGFGYTALLFTLILGKKALVAGCRDIEQVADLLLTEKADLLVGVPTALYKLADKLQGSNHSVHSIISGGAPLNDIIFSKLGNLTHHLFSMYGSTEASTSFIADYMQLSQHSCALGTPLKGINYRLYLLADGSNELLIQSGLSNTGNAADWIHTGDVVEQGPDGSITWCCRKDDMIIKSGINIYPAEIEKVLLKLACIEDACIVSEKDLIRGEIIVAFVKTKTDTIFDENKIKEQLRATLSGIKIPDKIFCVDYFEYTSTGKKRKPLQKDGAGTTG